MVKESRGKRADADVRQNEEFSTDLQEASLKFPLSLSFFFFYRLRIVAPSARRAHTRGVRRLLSLYLSTARGEERDTAH